MSRVRVLIVDDSVVVRRVLSKIFEATPDIEVAGIAATASIGIQKISQIQPDVVVLDVEMPEMGGIEAVTHIRASWPRLPVLMCSALTERGDEEVAKEGGLAVEGRRGDEQRDRGLGKLSPKYVLYLKRKQTT